ncbi:MAG: efflux RND transporter periplasmic adaptor subunit [Planctomycetota bacterium]
MSTDEQQPASSAAIRDEVRRTIQRLTEMAQTEESFDQFCDTVLSQVVKITGAHGALLWQVNGDNTPRLTHLSGSAPHDTARQVTSRDNPQHNKAILEVVHRQMPMGVNSNAFTGSLAAENSEATRDEAFLMLFSPVYSSNKECCGTLELVQRGDISTKAQEGYLRFLSQISQLFQRWFEKQDLSRLSENADSWHERMEFVHEIHQSIDHDETAYAIANETRRLLKCDRVSVGKWNGTRCKIKAISSQDRFDNRANVVRLLSNVATASVSADSQFWVVGSTEGLAPEVARKINEYLDESHSRTLVVIPLLAKAEEVPSLEMQSKNRRQRTKLGALVLEYFDADMHQHQIEDDVKLVVDQSEIALENTRKHGEIFMLPVWKRLGWLQTLLFRDHYRKTMTGLAALGILILAMIFGPKELRMKVEGVIHPSKRQTTFAGTDGIVDQILIQKERAAVEAGQPLFVLKNIDLQSELSNARKRRATTINQITDVKSQISSPNIEPQRREELGIVLNQRRDELEVLAVEIEKLEQKEKLLTVTSPISGTVITSQIRRRLNQFPVNPNYPLVEVADLDGDWQLELKVPQERVGHIDRAFDRTENQPLEVEFKIATDPNLNFVGKLDRDNLESRAFQKHSTGEIVIRAIVDIPAEQLEDLKSKLRSGAGVTARVRCGKHRLGYVWFYQIWDFIRTKVLF